MIFTFITSLYAVAPLIHSMPIVNSAGQIFKQVGEQFGKIGHSADNVGVVKVHTQPQSHIPTSWDEVTDVSFDPIKEDQYMDLIKNNNPSSKDLFLEGFPADDYTKWSLNLPIEEQLKLQQLFTKTETIPRIINLRTGKELSKIKKRPVKTKQKRPVKTKNYNGNVRQKTLQSQSMFNLLPSEHIATNLRTDRPLDFKLAVLGKQRKIAKMNFDEFKYAILKGNELDADTIFTPKFTNFLKSEFQHSSIRDIQSKLGTFSETHREIALGYAASQGNWRLVYSLMRKSINPHYLDKSINRMIEQKVWMK